MGIQIVSFIGAFLGEKEDSLRYVGPKYSECTQSYMYKSMQMLEFNPSDSDQYTALLSNTAT